MNADEKSYDDINVTPMVDLYLVLLLIFIIMTTAGVQGVKINLPKSAAAPELGDKKSQAITVNTEGKIFHNTVPVSIADLETRLGAVQSKTPEFPVIVRGDGQTHYQEVAQVLNLLGRLGITKIGLATEAAK
jgi:biopolymer transport protein ExbD